MWYRMFTIWFEITDLFSETKYKIRTKLQLGRLARVKCILVNHFKKNPILAFGYTGSKTKKGIPNEEYNKHFLKN